MAWEAVFLLLASGQANGAAASPPPRLICRYESTISRVLSRRKLCLTELEWQERDRIEAEAARRSIYELMGHPPCLKGGICTSQRSVVVPAGGGL